MGGDDLGSDDEYLNVTVGDNTLDALSVLEHQDTSKKRKRADDDQNEEKNPKQASISQRNLLLEAGRHLEREPLERQVAFLSKALKHYTLLSAAAEGKYEEVQLPKLLSSHFRSSEKGTLSERIKDSISLKKTRKWSRIGSPMVLVICLSARRAVQVLKELSFLKVRVAKLFAKHMDVNEQRSMLESSAFGLAVGTPHRLLALCEADKSGKRSLSLDNTQLVVFDSHMNSKAYTACTLPDTAPHCMEFVREQVCPQLQKRKDIRMAFF